jgi:hypothetical protein
LQTCRYKVHYGILALAMRVAKGRRCLYFLDRG